MFSHVFSPPSCEELSPRISCRLLLLSWGRLQGTTSYKLTIHHQHESSKSHHQATSILSIFVVYSRPRVLQYCFWKNSESLQPSSMVKDRSNVENVETDVQAPLSSPRTSAMKSASGWDFSGEEKATPGAVGLPRVVTHWGRNGKRNGVDVLDVWIQSFTWWMHNDQTVECSPGFLE